MSRRKPVRLGQRLTRIQLRRANDVLAAHHRPQLATGHHGKLPNVAALLNSISGIELTRATHIMRELTAALDGVGQTERRGGV